MVMSVGWNPYFKNEKITAVSGLFLCLSDLVIVVGDGANGARRHSKSVRARSFAKAFVHRSHGSDGEEET